jgi:hypothetical protein
MSRARENSSSRSRSGPCGGLLPAQRQRERPSGDLQVSVPRSAGLAREHRETTRPGALAYVIREMRAALPPTAGSTAPAVLVSGAVPAGAVPLMTYCSRVRARHAAEEGGAA